MSHIAPANERVARFARGLRVLGSAPISRFGVAVSGGPDSLALLVLAHAAFPGRVRAATVDHHVRFANADEARAVRAICDTLGVEHDTLAANDPLPANPSQNWARSLRYALLEEWAATHDLGALLTAHHLDDQAETLLMRANRASGVGGLAAVRRSSTTGTSRTRLLRPLLDWRRSELHAVVAASGLQAVDDPSNRNPAFDRTGVRALLAETPWLRPERLAATARHAADADAALDWSVRRLWEERADDDALGILLDLTDTPREYVRRLLVRGFNEIRETHLLGRDEWTPRGASIERLIRRSEDNVTSAGWSATLGGVLITVSGHRWRLTPAPPRRAVPPS